MLAALLPHERALLARLDTPRKVQRWLAELPYNKGNVGKTLRPFRGVIEHKTAHCLEGALAAAFILEHHGHAPLLLDLASSDGLDHVCFLFRAPTGWGTVSMSRYPGLMGRAPRFATVRSLAKSYLEPFVDATGAVRGYATFDLRHLATAGAVGRSRARSGEAEPRASSMDWALSRRNVWRIERALLANRHTPLRLSASRERELRARYLAWKAKHPDHEPPRTYYDERAHFW